MGVAPGIHAIQLARTSHLPATEDDYPEETDYWQEKARKGLGQRTD